MILSMSASFHSNYIEFDRELDSFEQYTFMQRAALMYRKDFSDIALKLMPNYEFHPTMPKRFYFEFVFMRVPLLCLWRGFNKYIKV